MVPKTTFEKRRVQKQVMVDVMVPKIRMEKARVCKTVMADVVVPKVNMVNCKRPKTVFVDMKQTVCMPKPDCAQGKCDTMPIPYTPQLSNMAHLNSYSRTEPMSYGNSYSGAATYGGSAVMKTGGGYDSGYGQQNISYSSGGYGDSGYSSGYKKGVVIS